MKPFDHLDEDTLNEYLDGHLTPDQQAACQAHLSVCQFCSQHLEDLQSVFTALGALPDLPLEQDLSAKVLVAIAWRTPHPAAKEIFASIPGPIPGVFPGWVPSLVLAFQALIAVSILALARPLAARWLDRPVSMQLITTWIENVTQGAAPQVAPWFILPISAIWFNLAEATRSAFNNLIPPIHLPTLPGFSMLEASLCLGGAGLLWLVGNGLLLSPNRSKLPWRKP